MTPIEEGFAHIYPTTTPHLAAYYQRFASTVETMILHQVGVQPVPCEPALQAVLQRLVPHDFNWWLLGSAAMAARGLDVKPGDIDLVTDDAGAHKLGEIFFD